MPMMPSALSPGASQHGNGRNTWAAAVRPGETRAQGGEHEPSPPQVAVGSDYPAHALVTRLSKELAAIPGGKNTRRERKRLTQRLYDAERTDAYVAESAAMAAAAATSAGGATNGGLATHLRACVRAQYGARTNAVTSRFVTLALDGQNGGQSPPIGVVRPLLYRLLDYRAAVRMADAVRALSGAGALDYMSDLLDLRVTVIHPERIPANGRCIVVANHPTGIADGIAVFDAIRASASRCRSAHVRFATASSSTRFIAQRDT